MPILAAAISSFFGFIASMLAKKLAMNVAAAGAFAVTAGAAYLAAKAAFAVLIAGLTAALPPAIVAGAGYFLPSNLPGCLTVILIADAIDTYYEHWRAVL